MRVVAAIIAELMTVAAGGSLRCPCEFAALLRDIPCIAKSAPVIQTPPTPSTTRHPGCGCKSRTADEPPPAEGRPTQPEPCKHGPGIDLVAPTAVGRQSGGDLGIEGASFATTSGEFLSCPAFGRNDLAERPPGSDSSLPTRLRFSHAFRC